MSRVKPERMRATVFVLLGFYFVIAAHGGSKSAPLAALLCGLIAGHAFTIQGARRDP